MPRRKTPDPTARAVGQRIRQLRSERGLTAERLAFESDLASKGYLSDIEHGRASPSLQTLQVIADYLEVLLVDLFTFPENDERQALIDRSRWLSAGSVRKLLRDLPTGPRRGGPALVAAASNRYGAARREPTTLGVADSGDAASRAYKTRPKRRN